MEFLIFNTKIAKRGKFHITSLFMLVNVIAFAQTWEIYKLTESNEEYPTLSYWNNEYIIGYISNKGAQSNYVLKFINHNGEITTKTEIPAPQGYSFIFNSKLTINEDTLFILGNLGNKISNESSIFIIKYNLITYNHTIINNPTLGSSDYFLDYIVSDSTFIIPGFSLTNGLYKGSLKEFKKDGSLLKSKEYPNGFYISGYLWNSKNLVSLRTVGTHDIRVKYSNFEPIDTVTVLKNMSTWGGSLTSSYNKANHFISGDYFDSTQNGEFCSVIRITSDSVFSKNYLFGELNSKNKIQGVQPVAEIDSNKLFIVGSTSLIKVIPSMSPEPTKITLFKTNQNGDTLFLKFYKGEVKYIANSIIATPDGGALIASQKYDWNSPYPNQWDIHLLKVDSLGNYTPLGNTDIDTHTSTKLKIYPNPSNGYFSISGIKQYPVTLTLYDILGREVKNTTLNTQDERIDISSLKQGTYIYRVQLENEIVNGRFLVR